MKDGDSQGSGNQKEKTHASLKKNMDVIQLYLQSEILCQNYIKSRACSQVADLNDIKERGS